MVFRSENNLYVYFTVFFHLFWSWIYGIHFRAMEMESHAALPTIFEPILIAGVFAFAHSLIHDSKNILIYSNRRKFRSQTSDNMDRWKAEMGRVREEKRRRKKMTKIESLRRKKIQVREKVGKSRSTVFFQWFVAPEGRKSRLAKAAGAEPAGQMRHENCTPLWREAHFEVKMYKTPHVRATFGGSDVVSRGRRKGLCTLSKVSKTWGFCRISKNHGWRGTFEEDLERCISRGRRSTRDMFIRDVRRPGRWFPEKCCILEHQICRFAETILRDRCSTSYDLASLLRGRRNTLDRWSAKIAKRIGTRASALHSTFHFEGSVAELFHFWCCQLRKLRKSRRLVSFLMLSSSKIEEVSQTCCVFKLTDRQLDR